MKKVPTPHPHLAALDDLVRALASVVADKRAGKAGAGGVNKTHPLDPVKNTLTPEATQGAEESREIEQGPAMNGSEGDDDFFEESEELKALRMDQRKRTGFGKHGAPKLGK